MTTFETRDPNKHPRPPVCWRSGKNYFVGLALGGDPAAVCVIEAYSEREDPARPMLYRYDIRHLARMPVGMMLPDIVREVGALLRQPPLYQPDLVINETEVGKPVTDLFHALKPVRAVIGPGGSDGKMAGGLRYEVSRSFLRSNLNARLHDGSLSFAPDLDEVDALVAEIGEVRADDSDGNLVIATSLALWRATKRKASFDRSPASVPKVLHEAPKR
jgi:hypothetical protein